LFVLLNEEVELPVLDALLLEADEAEELLMLLLLLLVELEVIDEDADPIEVVLLLLGLLELDDDDEVVDTVDDEPPVLLDVDVVLEEVVLLGSQNSIVCPRIGLSVVPLRVTVGDVNGIDTSQTLSWLVPMPPRALAIELHVLVAWVACRL
jgi:hypothetical protein